MADRVFVQRARFLVELRRGKGRKKKKKSLNNRHYIKFIFEFRSLTEIETACCITPNALCIPERFIESMLCPLILLRCWLGSQKDIQHRNELSVMLKHKQFSVCFFVGQHLLYIYPNFQDEFITSCLSYYPSFCCCCGGEPCRKVGGV